MAWQLWTIQLRSFAERFRRGIARSWMPPPVALSLMAY
jgi:hypothetical protein